MSRDCRGDRTHEVVGSSGKAMARARKQITVDSTIKDRSVKALYDASVAQDVRKLATAARKVLDSYYGKTGGRPLA